MTITKGFAGRRNSIAVAGRSQVHPGHRRRAHSIAPGGHLSPASKTRRAVAPRKSILKAAANVPDDGEDRTQTMEMTGVVRFDVDNTRRSLGRRVSFADHAHVRLFEVPEPNTNSTASPQSSPAVGAGGSRETNDENVYPGAASFRRRSSIPRSSSFGEGDGEESMDMDSDDTGYSPAAFIRVENVPGNEDNIDGFDEEGHNSDDENMDVTEAIPHNILRKRSLSFGVSRRPLASLSAQAPPDNQGQAGQEESTERSFVEDDSLQSQPSATEENTLQPMEFTVPLIRPPQPPSEAWLALRAATHSGNTPFVPSSDDEEQGGVQEMELTDAFSRLQAARKSLELDNVGEEDMRQDSFTSTEDSLVEENSGTEDEGNKTVNVTQLMQRVSLAPVASLVPEAPFVHDDPKATPSSSVVPLTESSEAHRETPGDAASLESPVHSSAHGESQFSGQPSTVHLALKPFSFAPRPQTPASPAHPRPASPSKGKERPASPRKFTAAFAPPVSRPSPGKRPSAVACTPDDRPSPAKRLSCAPLSGASQLSKMAPSKTVSFRVSQDLQPGTGPSKRLSLGFRRPSGYFAQQKSLGTSVREGVATSDVAAEKEKATNDCAMQGHHESAEPSYETEEQVRETEVTETESPAPVTPDVATDAGEAEEDLRVEQDPTSADKAPDSATEQWQGDVQHGDLGGEEGPQISIEQFFEMTGIRFLDEITAPRRATAYPSSLRTSRRASTDGQIPLAEYVVAMALDVPQLELYTHVSKDLQAWIERIQGIFKEAEDEVLKMPPQLFQEFVMTDEAGQADLIHQLKLIKVHNHEQAKSEWYDWKMQWVEQLHQKATQAFQDLEADARILEGIIREAQDLIPGLQQEYDELIRELEQEKADVVELENCDQDYLNELKGTIAEQSAELESFRRDVEEGKGKLDRLEEKLVDTQTEKKEVSSSVLETERLIHVQKNSTRAEVFRLKDELEFLQSLNMVEITKVRPDLFEFLYASCYRVSIPCAQFRPLVGNIQIVKVPDAKMKYKETFPALNSLVLRTAKELINQPADSIRQLVGRFGDYWSSCSQLQTQLKLVAIKYPVDIQENTSGFSAHVTILYTSARAKAIISFTFDTANLSSFPRNICSTRCDVRVAYGKIDRETILNAVIARMKDTSPIKYHACLLDACIEASECLE